MIISSRFWSSTVDYAKNHQFYNSRGTEKFEPRSTVCLYRRSLRFHHSFEISETEDPVLKHMKPFASYKSVTSGMLSMIFHAHLLR